MQISSDNEVLAMLSAIINELALEIDEGLSRPVQTWGAWLNGEGYDTNGLDGFLAEVANETEVSLLQLRNDYASACHAEASTADFIESLNTKAPAFIAAVNERVQVWRDSQQQINTIGGGSSVWSNTRISGHHKKEVGTDIALGLAGGAIIGVSYLIYRAISKSRKEAAQLVEHELDNPSNEAAIEGYELGQIRNLDLDPSREIGRYELKAEELRPAQIEANVAKLDLRYTRLLGPDFETGGFREGVKSLMTIASADVIEGADRKLNPILNTQLLKLFGDYPDQSYKFEIETMRMARGWAVGGANKFEGDFKWADKTTLNLDRSINGALGGGLFSPNLAWDVATLHIRTNAMAALDKLGIKDPANSKELRNFFKMDKLNVVLRDDKKFVKYIGSKNLKPEEIAECMNNLTQYLETYNRKMRDSLDGMIRARFCFALKLLISPEKSGVPDARALVGKEFSNAEVQLEKDTLKQMAVRAKGAELQVIDEVENSLEQDIEVDKKIIDNSIGSIVDDL